MKDEIFVGPQIEEKEKRTWKKPTLDMISVPGTRTGSIGSLSDATNYDPGTATIS